MAGTKLLFLKSLCQKIERSAVWWRRAKSSLPPTTQEVRPRLSVCLSVQDNSKTRAWIWMKCCEMSGHGTNWLTFEPDPAHSPDAGTGLLSPIAYALQRDILLRRENPYWARVVAATRGFESYALQGGISLRRENPTYLYLGARRSSDAWFWGFETPLSEVNALYRVHLLLALFLCTHYREKYAVYGVSEQSCRCRYSISSYQWCHHDDEARPSTGSSC